MNYWVVRSKPHGIPRFDEFLAKKIVCIGWPATGDLTGKTKSQLRQVLSNFYSYPEAELRVALGNVNTFVNRIEPKDMVLVPYFKRVAVGKVISDYKYDPSLVQDGYCHYREVDWLGVFDRNLFSPDLEATLCCRTTVCHIRNHLHIIDNLLTGNTSTIKISPTQKKTNEINSDPLGEQARSIINSLLNSEDPEVKLKAAVTYLKAKGEL